MDRQLTSRTIIIPIGEAVYNAIVDSKKQFQLHLDSLIEQYPELFPLDITHGYIFYGWAKSCEKIQLPRRRIFLKYSRQEYLIHPISVAL